MIHPRDVNDPTVALFISEKGAMSAAALVRRAYPETVTRCEVKPRNRRGELLGFQVIAHKTDRSAEPITNADFERLST